MLIPDLSPLWISLKVSLLATLVTFGLGTIVAYKMYHYRGKARSLIEGLLIAPLILPPTVVGFVLLVLLGKNGVLGQMLAQWHLQLVFTWYAAVWLSRTYGVNGVKCSDSGILSPSQIWIFI